MKKALFTGSFDPVTLGHLDTVERAAKEYDSLTVGLFVNPQKTYYFTEEERLTLLQLAIRHLSNVEVILSHGYVADFAKEGGYTAIVRGVRNQIDLSYETDMAAYNLQRGGVPTQFWEATPGLSHISSSAVRELIEQERASLSYADLAPLLPAAIIPTVLKLVQNKS